MAQLPAVGTRVSLRYRLPSGSMPPMTDVVGHLEAVGPTLRVRTKRDELVNVAAEDVVAIKALTAVPVRTGDIRNLEHAAALAWPGIEHEWIDGWLLRYGNGSTRRANSAVPLAVSTVDQLAAIIDWYAGRGTPPLLAVPDRLFRIPPGVPVGGENLVMTTELATATPSTFDVTLSARPDDEWLRLYRRDVPPGVLTAVIDGELAFATMAGAAVGRAALTTAPDGTSWVGLSAVHVMEQARGRGLARALCSFLLSWGAGRSATRAYVQVLTDNAVATGLYESMGFGVHHRSRYVRADEMARRDVS